MKKIYTGSYITKKWKFYLPIILIIFFSSSFAQQQIPAVKINQLNKVSPKNFNQIQKDMKDYWDSRNTKGGTFDEDGEDGGAPGWSLYKRWEYYWEQRININTGEFPKTNSVIEYEKYKASKNALRKTAYNESWTNLGTNSSNGGYAGIGRINCIAFDPTDSLTFWVGSPSGGIWKTTDGGSTWAILNNDQLVLGVSAIAVPSDYATSNTIYIATGDRDLGSLWSLSGQQGAFADNVSIGVLRSTDGGTTWETTGLNFSKNLGKIIYSLRIDPTDNSILFAATTDGIYKSTDGGTSWNLKTSNVWGNIEFKPGDHNIMYASSNPYHGSYINRSTDNGNTWSYSSIDTGGYRSEIAVSANDPTVVYFLAANSAGGVDGIYKSTNSGVSFTKVNSANPSGMLGYYTDGSGGSSGQGWYDLCVAADPSNVNTVFIGGITTWKSTDGGVTFKAINNWTSSAAYNKSHIAVVHADKHVLAYQNSSTLFEGCDGGIYKTTNGGTSYTDLTNGMVISQIYRISVSQTSASEVLNGLQDNGSKLYNAGFWSDVTGGDGTECIIDYSNSNYMYAAYVQGTIYRSTNGGSDNFPTTISVNIPAGQPAGKSPTGAWVTPYIIDPNNTSTLYAGYDKVWKTTDRGNTWTSISQQLSPTVKLRSLAIAPSNSSDLYTADQSNMWKTTDGGTSNWSSITLPSISNYITFIAVKNTDPNTLWITLGGYTDGSKVFESTDGGSTWTNISTGLPNLPIMCIAYYKTATDRDVLFVGTDVGVYVKDGANTWVAFNTGLPNVVVSDLDIHYTGSTNELIAGTYGRGLWETAIDNLLPVELASFTSTFKDNHVTLNWFTKTELNNYGFEIERKTDSTNIDNWTKIGFVLGSGNSNSQKNYSFIDNNVNNGIYEYRLKQIDDNGQFKYSNTTKVTINSIPKVFALNQNFPNPFNPSTKISYKISKIEYVSLKVYDILGNEVSTLVNGKKYPGNYEVNFDASNLSSGVYFYQITAGNFVQTKKMILLK